MSNQENKNLLSMKSHRKCNKDIVSTLPKNEHYRDELSALLGSCITLETTQWVLVDDIVDGVSCTRILLRNARVLKMPAYKRDSVPNGTIVEHIWTAVDSGWRARILPTYGQSLWVKGFLYEYERDGKRNIGIQTITAYTKLE